MNQIKKQLAGRKAMEWVDKTQNSARPQMGLAGGFVYSPKEQHHNEEV